MLSRFFINRPIFATVLAILMIIVGLITVESLPVAQYPDITPPTVMVSASYPGADAKTVAETIGIPIEEQVNGIEGMMYMSSTSGSDGSYNLTITFQNGVDLDEATVKVQNRIAMADAQLPSAVKQQGVSVMSESSNIVLFVALKSTDPKRYDALYLTNYAKLHLVDDLARVEGVGGVGAFGAGEYSMRIWLNPAKMQVRGLTPADVVGMIESQNMAVSAGSVGAPPTSDNEQFQYTVTSQGRLTTPDEFADIILRTDENGGMLRLGDVADIALGSESYSVVSRVDGQQAALIAIQQLPGANALDVAKRSEERLKELAQYFPQDIQYDVVLNSTDVVTASINEVLRTLLETTLIVMLVILLFLQNWRAVIIPMLTIPVSLIATFAIMKLMGFTINTLTLFGMVLAIAIVVDDAIVVVEDCARLLDEGKLTQRQAALKAMQELQGPVVGEVLVLLSVFIPTAFISGITGELYKQFALTIAVSTAFSGFNALTFTPAMCAIFLKPRKPARFFLYKWFNTAFAKTLNGYSALTGRMLKHPLLSLVIFAVIVLAAFWGFDKWPTSYIPAEDQGYFITAVELPTDASIDRTDAVMQKIQNEIQKIPEVQNIMTISGHSFVGGGSGANSGSMFVVLKPWSERRGKNQSVDAVIEKVDEITSQIQEAVCFSINPPAIPGLGLTSGEQMQLLDINNLGADQLLSVINEMKAAAQKDPRLASITSMYEGNVPQYTLKIDRNKVKLYNLTMSDVYSALSSFMGGSYVNDFVDFGRVYQVNVTATAAARGSIDDIAKLSVRNSDGNMVTFGAFSTVEPSMGESTVSRYNMFETASVTGTPAKGVSTSEAIKAMEDILQQTAGNNFSYAWTGEAYQETQAGTTIAMVLIFAIIITILVLAAQYESWTDPIAVVITTPTAILGTILGCIFMSQSVSIYTQIGIILLLGMSAKNAILIVEYAMDFRKSGVDITQAALDAGKIRLRPILMTALAFVFGIMPMLFATGAGAASRISLGTAVVFGMAVNAIVGTLFVPNFWSLLQHFNEKYLSGLFKQIKPSGVDTNITTPESNNDNSASSV